MARRGRPRSSPVSSSDRPRRTREHIQEELSRLHVQMLAAQCGFVAERVEHDYGYDLILLTYDEQGEMESAFLYIQLKAVDNLQRLLLSDGQTIAYTVERRHLVLWCTEPMPVILIIYDVREQQGYWVYVQRAFSSLLASLADDQQNVSLRIPTANRLDADAFRLFRTWKQNILNRLEELRLHEASSNNL